MALPETVQERVLEALGDPTRRRILRLLRDEPRAITELADRLPVSRPAVSKHLGKLRTAELVSREVQGLEILFWDAEAEDWDDEWEPENSVPERVLLTIFVASEDDNDEPIQFARMVEIPVAKSVTVVSCGPSTNTIRPADAPLPPQRETK